MNTLGPYPESLGLCCSHLKARRHKLEYKLLSQSSFSNKLWVLSESNKETKQKNFMGLQNNNMKFEEAGVPEGTHYSTHNCGMHWYPSRTFQFYSARLLVGLTSMCFGSVESIEFLQHFCLCFSPCDRIVCLC